MAETFSADWLALREPADHRARPDALVAPLREWGAARGAWCVVDLGCGTGSNARWLAPRLGGTQHWTLVDHDAALLATAATSVRALPGVAEAGVARGDLAREGLEAVAGADLVTASALLDLVSEAWVERLAEACAKAGAAALFALTWDGVLAWDGAPDPDDARVAEAVRAHQRRDKGMGAALGPTGGETAERAFAARGYRTRCASSPWVIESARGAGDRALAAALVTGWAEAAAEQDPGAAARIHAWAERRGGVVRTGVFRLTVGHVDLLALPPG